MELTLLKTLAISAAILGIASTVVKALKIVWLKPKKLEKHLRGQGFKGNSYRPLLGDMMEYVRMTKHAKSKHLQLSDNVSLHALPYVNHIINKFGKSSYIWWGPQPKINIQDPELFKEIMTKPSVFLKPNPNPVGDLVTGGLLAAEGEKWIKHRKLMDPAFHIQKLKSMVPAIHSSCRVMINKWDMLVVAKGGSAEVDVWPDLAEFSGDVISQTAFGSNHEDGRRIFLLQQEQVGLVLHLFGLSFVPGWRYIPTKANLRMKQVCKELQALLRDVISKREKAIKTKEDNNNDLLGILLESNSKEIEEHGMGMSIDEVAEECKLFYFAGSETTSNLLTWTMVLLSVHPDWQTRAREEVQQVFGNKNPDFDGLNNLKIVTTILQEVLRLYPPVPILIRDIPKDTKLGDIDLLSGMGITLPIILLHYDQNVWGIDAHEFNPMRFSEGVLSATKRKFAYIPFGAGTRICIGQNFAMIEAKMALSMILQSFSFELSPWYVHAPFPVLTLQPQQGAPIILHKL